MTSRNQQLFERAQHHIPGGVNSPVRAFRSVGGTPLFLKKGRGARVQDADGKWYTDYVGSWGPMILGHAHPTVIAAVQAAAADGLSFGAPTEREVEMADLLCELVGGPDFLYVATTDYPASGALLDGANGAAAAVLCSGTLIGCGKFLTAGHCVDGSLDPADYTVFFQHAGFFAVASIARHPRPARR